MKKLFILITFSFLLISCSSNLEEITSYKYNGAWYWVVEHKANTTEKEVKDFVNTWSNPNTTSYFFIYSDNYNLNDFKEKGITFETFRGLIINNNPTYGFYKMPNDQKIYDDAVWLLEQSVK